MKRLIILIYATCLCLGSVLGQSLDSSLNVYNNKYPQEKIHIHFDKDAYLPGETVWLKAYLQSDAKPSSISKNLYFDWTDADGRLFLHSVSPINEGGASSYFHIPAWVRNGVIHVKAYTQWMLNFDNAFLFNKDIPVLMPLENGSRVAEKIQTMLNFFPEGGDLVNGVSSVLAFEALNQHGKPVLVHGALKNSNDIIIDSFFTSHLGMGTVRFKPLNGEHYTASWTDETGELHNSPIPMVKPNGLVIHVDPYQNDQIRYKLEKSVDASNLTNILVIGTINQKIVYRNILNLENNKAESSISTTSFPCGILQLTALDGNMSPLSERVVFINNGKAYAKIQLKKESINLNKRARNEISLEIPDSLVTNLSVSVTDAGMGSDSSYNIYSDFLIAGDLKGTIPDAASFLENGGNANEYLNLLLLTHGWRRFDWENIVSGTSPYLKYPRDAGFLAVKGEIRNNGNSLDGQDSMALLMISRDRKKHLLKLPVDSEGKFIQNNLFFYDSVQVVYRFNHGAKLGENTHISLYADLLPPLTAAKADDPSFAWIKVPDVILEKEMNGNIIETKDYSVPSASLSYIVSPKTDSMGRNSESAAHYLTDNFAELRFPTILKGNNSSGDGRLASYHPGKSTTPGSNVNVTVDGTPMAMDDLKNVSMKEVLYIKFIPKSNSKSLPTLAITSRQSLDQASILENKTGFAIITGYTPVREFYQPHYDANKTDDYQATDFRSTLYWNPKLRLDKSHRKMNFVFYNNDVSNKLRIVIEGMNQEGKLCRIEELIK